MDKLNEKFKALTDKIYYGNDNAATACAELTKEMMQKWNKFLYDNSWEIILNDRWRRQLKNGIWEFIDFSELFTLFLEQENL